jgi:hypothetical protein
VANLYNKSSFPSYQDNSGSIRRIFSTTLWSLVSSEGTSLTTTPTGMSLVAAYLILVPSFIGPGTIFLEAFEGCLFDGGKRGTGE